MSLSSQNCICFLQRCTTDREVEEVLSAYIYSKFNRSWNSEKVMVKLQKLTQALRDLNLSHLLHDHSTVFKQLSFHIQHLNGGGIGANPVLTSLGNEAWNQLRRSPSFLSHNYDPWGARGPGSVTRIYGCGPFVMRDVEEVRECVGLRGDEELKARLTPEYLASMGLGLPFYEVGEQTLPVYERVEGESTVAEEVQA